MISSMMSLGSFSQKGGFDRESNQRRRLLKGGGQIISNRGVGTADLRRNTDATATPLFRFLLIVLGLFLAGCSGNQPEPLEFCDCYRTDSPVCHCFDKALA